MPENPPDGVVRLVRLWERLALVGKTLFLVSFGFYLFLGAVTDEVTSVLSKNFGRTLPALLPETVHDLKDTADQP